MNNIEIITAKNAERLDELTEGLADVYIDAFARPPWNEVSKCPRCGAFSSTPEGSQCTVCEVERQAAYTADELAKEWRDILDDNGVMEIAYGESGQPRRTTIAGVLSPDRLFARKYQDVPAMASWLADMLPAEFVYIYDTFADLRVSPSGNLSDRGATLGRIAGVFSGLSIVTRTLQPAIVRATVRDAGRETDVYIGERRVGLQQAVGARAILDVPDRRTLLCVRPQL